MKITENFLFRSFFILSLVFVFTAQEAVAQESGTGTKCNGTSCSCGGSIIAGSCSIKDCCKPNIARCDCHFYSSHCSCLPEGSSFEGVPIPPVYEQNILEFANLLNSAAFNSAESKAIAQKLPVLISSSRSNDNLLYFGTSVELDQLSRKLPASEKQKVNAWIGNKGGTVFIE